MTASSGFLRRLAEAAASRDMGRGELAGVRAAARDALPQLQDCFAYLDELEAARDLKAAHPGLVLDIEHSLAVRARGLVTAVYGVARGVMKSADAVRAAGLFPGLLRDWKEAVAEAGQVRIAPIVDELLSMEGYKAALREHGFSAQRLKRLSAGLHELAILHEVAGGELLVRAGVRGEAVAVAPFTQGRRRLSIAEPPAGDSLFACVLRSLDERIRPLPVASVWVPPGAGPQRCSMDQLILDSVLWPIAEAEEHARQMEDVGLDAYRGGPPVAIAIGIGLLVATYLASVVVSALCLFDVVEGEVCKVAHAISTFGTFLLFGGTLEVCKHDAYCSRSCRIWTKPTGILNGKTSMNSSTAYGILVSGAMEALQQQHLRSEVTTMDEIYLHGDIPDVLLTWLDRYRREEICGFLVGHNDGRIAGAASVEVARNVCASMKFGIPTHELNRIKRAALARGQTILAVFHTHPREQLALSEADRLGVRRSDLPWVIGAIAGDPGRESMVFAGYAAHHATSIPVHVEERR